MAEPLIAGTESKNLGELGFSDEKGGAHASRTIMLNELQILFSAVRDTRACKNDFRSAIVDENVLGKRSEKTRVLTFRHLVDLYGLDPKLPVFRGLRFFWERDEGGEALSAFLCAFSRDSLLRSSFQLVLSAPYGSVVSRELMEGQIEAKYPGRFSTATLKSSAQNINSSWTKAGHLSGRVRKIRTPAEPTLGSAAYAVFLGYLNGIRGSSLFESEYAKILDCSADRVLELVQQAALKGWMTVNRIGDVVEVAFPNIITLAEKGILREQS